MQWTSKDNGWRWRFALLPFSLRDDSDGRVRRWVWLEWYRAQDCGDHVQVEIAPFNA